MIEIKALRTSLKFILELGQMNRKKIIAFILFTLGLLSLTPMTYAVKFNTEASIREEVIYDILIDRFNNHEQAINNEVNIDDPYAYHGGDFQGITAMLDTLQTYGFTAISLSPVMKNAPKGYHGYWIEDFYEVEETFGTIEDLRELIDEAHDRGMKVFIEFVPNYVAKSSLLVEEKSKENWFKEVTLEQKDATKWLEEVVQFNHEEEAVRQFLIEVALYWMEELAIDGYMLHAVDQADLVFIEQLTKAIKEKDPEFFLLASSLQDDSLDAYCEVDTIDALTNEALRTKIVDVFAQVGTPVKQLSDSLAQLPCDKVIYTVDHKNSPRFSQVVAEGGRNAITTWKLALLFMYASPGVPLLYQGSEVPMYGAGFPENQQLVDFISADPDFKQVFERLSAAKKRFPALSHGTMEEIAVDEGFSLFKREYEGEIIYFAINNDSQSRYVTLDELEGDVQLRGLFYDDTIRPNNKGEFYIGLDRETAEIFVIEENIGINWFFIVMVSLVMLIFVLGVFYLSMKQRQREKAEKI